MPRYIDAEVAEANFEKITGVGISFAGIPTADVAPITHAHWNYLGEFDKEGNFIFRCSSCHAIDIKSGCTPINYCWHCGAKMDEEMSK